MSTDAIRAETVWLDGAVDPSADRGLEAYLAHPVERQGVGGVVVIHHMPGYDEATPRDHAQPGGRRVRRHLPEPLLA